MAGFVARFPQRPSDILGFKGSSIERMLLDVEILTELNRPSTLTDKIRRERAGYRYVS